MNNDQNIYYSGFKIEDDEEEKPPISPEIESLTKFQKVHFRGDITKYARSKNIQKLRISPKIIYKESLWQK